MEPATSDPIIFGIGNTFIDWYGEASQDLLDQYGLKFGVPGELTTDQIPVLKDLEKCDNYQEMPGGSTLNTLRCINYLMKRDYKKESTTLYFGAITKDDKGAVIKELLDKDGVNYRFDEKDTGYTGQWAIIIVNSERTPVSNSGVNESYSTDHLNENLSLITPVRMCYIEGFFVSSNYEAIKEIWGYAQSNEKLFAFNLWGEFWIETYSERYLEILPYCDLLFGNEEEFKALAKIIQYEGKDDDLEDLVKVIASYEKETETSSSRIVLMSRDKNEAIFNEYSFSDETHNLFKVPPVSLKSSQIVDTCCAGDTFVGGFLAGYLNGKDYKECVEDGHKIASIVVQKIGWYFE